ncbi:fungal-specific transcription factor domain-containing protein [Trichophaea hybrida]|nr:fungal-specific transcription factor domain-containing protein [Trichophaea hybrida]
MNRDHSEESNSASASASASVAANSRATPAAEQNGGGSKRKRVSLACNACRLRKSKCDGVRPKCCMCRDLDFDCVYQQSASSANTIVSKDYIGRLESRLLAVENLLAAQVSISQQRNSSTPVADELIENDRGESVTSVSRAKRKREDSPPPVPGSSWGHLEDDTPAPDTVLDGMGALNLGDEDDYGYFGPSSNIAFIGHVTRALATSVSVSGAFQKDLRKAEASEIQSRPLSPRPGHNGTAEFDVRPDSVNIYAIPAEHKVRHYISQYFQSANILYPYLHQPTFIETYEMALKDGFTKVRRTWLALLNLVMAMGSRASTETDVSTEEKYKTAELFYQRGHALCNGYLLRLASLDSVNLLLLMSHYLQSTRKPVQCWTTHGVAIRIAIQLGLHSTQALQRYPPLERELRKRAWYGCVLLDRIIDSLYGGNLGGTDQSGPTFTDVARIAEIEEKLAAWRQNLPQALQIVSASDIPEGGGPSSQFWRQSIILSLRYHNTRALLHRQFAVKGLSEIWGAGPSTNRFEGDFFWNFGLASIKACSDSAIETVEIIHKVKYRLDLLGFCPRLRVLIVSQVRQLAHRRDAVLETGNLLTHLEMAMETLDVLATGNRIANRCRLFLKNLMRYVAPLGTVHPPPPYPPVNNMYSNNIPHPNPPPVPFNQHQQTTPYSAVEEYPHPQPDAKSPFRGQLGEFMLESDFTYLHSILPPLGMEEIQMEGEGGAAYHMRG